MTPTKLDTESINSLIETQLAVWPDAKRNFDRLREIKRKNITLGALEAWVQCNPARIVSTGAKTDARTIAERPCFLCRKNRPKEQITVEWMPGWELLVNPFPILPVHFTVVSTEHKPQSHIPYEMATMAEAAPDLAIFFNGARAGASAPDHLHVQAVLKKELPLLLLAERIHTSDLGHEFNSAQHPEITGRDFPFAFDSFIIPATPEGMEILKKIPYHCGLDADTGEPDMGLVNAFFWMDGRGILRAVVVPRKRHRPLCYGLEASDFIVSPGALDMAGIMVTPREEDFNRMDETKMREIYSDVAF